MKRASPWLALALIVASFLPGSALLVRPGLTWSGASSLEARREAQGWWRQPRTGSVFFHQRSQDLEVLDFTVGGQSPRRGKRDQGGLLGCVDLEAGLHPVQLIGKVTGARPELQLLATDEIPREQARLPGRLTRSAPLAAGWAWSLRLLAVVIAGLHWRWARRLAGALVGLVLAWGAAELGLVVTGTEPRARIPGSIWVDYDFGPGKTVTYRGVHATQVQEFATEVTWNQLGFRDTDWSQDPQRPSRALVLGDSFVAAHEVPLAEAFHSRLEESFPEVEFLAMARGGTGPVQQVDLLATADMPGLRAVLWALFPGNDIMDSSPALAKQRRTWVEQTYYGRLLPARVRLLNACARPGRALPWALDRSLPWIERHSPVLFPLLFPGLYGGVDPSDLSSPAAQVFAPGGSSALWDTAWTAVESALRRGQVWCEQRQLPLLVMILPTQGWPLPGPSPSQGQRSGPSVRLHELCDRLQIEVLPLEPLFDGQDAVFFPHDGHWSPRGHRVIATGLEKELRARGWPQVLAR